jgi:hypothetical protein
MICKPTRIEAALQLRDHALAILRRHGSYKPIGDAKYLMWDGEGFGNYSLFFFALMRFFSANSLSNFGKKLFLATLRLFHSRPCYSLKSFLIQSKTAARQRTPMKEAAVFS